MFCSNCGKQLPENAKFCNHCGAQQALSGGDNAAARQQSGVRQPSAGQSQEAARPAGSEKAPKKKTNIVVVLAVVLAAFLIGKFVIAPSMVSEPDDGDHSGSQNPQSQQGTSSGNNTANSVANPAYEAILTDAYIVHFQTFFNMEMESFALKQEDGIICCADYGYKDDVVKQWVETIYIPVSEYSDSQKAEVESTMKAEFAAVDALSCCTVTYKMGTNYFTITCTYADVDKSENYAELYNAGVLSANTFISMSATEGTLVSQGFVKK